MGIIKENLKRPTMIFAVLFMIIFAGCSLGNNTGDNKLNMTNPASSYCINSGYKLTIETNTDGSQTGYCIFPDGNKCEEWAFFRGECSMNNTNSQSGDLKKFTNSDELNNYVKKINENQVSYSSTLAKGISLASESISARSDSMSYDASNSGTGASEYSTTNVQVEGVDEADIVKTDGKYIYGITGNKLYIMSADKKDSKVIYETKLQGYYGQQIFVKDEILVLFTNSYREVETISKYDFMPRISQEQITNITLYNISNREKPQIIKNYELSGYYYDSRMIGDYVYVISNEYGYFGDVIPMPYVKSNNAKIISEVYYFDKTYTSFTFNTVASFNINDLNEEINTKSFMLENSNTLYVSENNIYIAYQNWNRYFRGWGYNYENEEKSKFFDVIVPLLPSETQDKIDSLGKDATWDKLSEILQNMYNNMSEDEKKSLTKKIEIAVEEYEVKQEEERSKTYIHKISINNGKIEYVAKGEVKGSLLNQFSLDEFNNSLRVATTYNTWKQDKSIVYNNVYILDENMNTVGTLEKIAPDERIYSTRFMGDKLYMVTFKQIDPLFVIDLSEKTKPEILGYLKIPGFSTYLQSYDDTHLIGIGKDTYTEKNITRTKGVKISMFDISDFSNPKEVDSVTIGDEGSYSDVESDHKSLLLDKRKNLLVLPITEVTGKYEYDKYGYYRNNVWQGVYVFTVTENGFEQESKISHEEKVSKENYYYSDYLSNVKRSLFIDNALYTISSRKIKINDLNSLDEIKEVKLPYEEQVYDLTPIYYADVTSISSDLLE